LKRDISWIPGEKNAFPGTSHEKTSVGPAGLNLDSPLRIVPGEQFRRGLDCRAGSRTCENTNPLSLAVSLADFVDIFPNE